MPDLSKYDGMTFCTAEKWAEQKECSIEGAEKSPKRDACIYFSADTDDKRCGNPNARNGK